ncbi:hypothetical protein, partial [Enterocloster bolteae]|uniref:hypothetical protein n=1 Tax=Enterocloster bolteae TaxID=208479 RepID=UPI0034A12ABB
MIVEIIFSVFGLLLSIYGVCHLIRSEKKPNDYKKYGTLYRPPKVRPKNLTIGGRYFYGKIQL